MDIQTLRKAMGNNNIPSDYVAHFNAAMKAADINNQKRIAMFCAQVGHESLGLHYMREIASGAAYEGRKDLGNIYPGDGVRFAGKGPLQLTGRANYRAFTKWCHSKGLTKHNFEAAPHLVERPQWGFLSAAWYWKIARPQLNALADSVDLEGATRAINGGLRGLEDRRARYRRCMQMNLSERKSNMTIKPVPGWRGDPMWLADVIRAYGVKVVELPGWKTWGNGDFGAIKGIIVHHTGANSTSAQYIARNPGLGNALSSQVHLSRTGVATMCGVGVAWHAGRGSYPGWQTNNANWEAIGIEAQSDGTSPWPAAQMEAYYKICAAILMKLGKRATPQTLIAHWEYSRAAQGKWDPGAGNGRSGAVMDMNHFRNRVNYYIDNPPWKQRAVAAKKEEDPLLSIKYFTDFIKGYVGPLISDAKDIRQQLTGGRNRGQYPGWKQLGTTPDGKGLTLVDGVAALRRDVLRLEKKLDQITKEGK